MGARGLKSLQSLTTGTLGYGFESRSSHGRIYAFSCVDEGISVGHFPVQGVLPKYLRGFTVLEVNSESE